MLLACNYPPPPARCVSSAACFISYVAVHMADHHRLPQRFLGRMQAVRLFVNVYVNVCVCVLMQPPSDSDQESSQCVPPPVSESPPAPPSPESPAPALAPPSSSQLEEPDAGLVGGEQEPSGAACRVTEPSAAEEGAAVTAAATHIPLAEVKLESILDPTELSTVSAERHRPGAQLSPKQRQSQKPPATAV